ncbi:MAG: GNAT family N-acetyltransferase [Phycisphaerales bacterium]|nr:GNAT family N-acetyltransferase [Phycisphaerales bacterium]
MTRCNSENLFPSAGLGWTPPEPLTCYLESDRLVIRSYRLEDSPELFKAVTDSRDGHLLPWMSWCKNFHMNIEQSTKYICDQILALENPSTFNNVGTGIFSKETGQLLGACGVHDVRRDTASCETGYWIRKDAIGNGYAREACARTISWALASHSNGGLGLQRVRIYCSSLNTHSTRLIEQLGITAEVRQRNDYYIETLGATDRLGWGVLSDEWDCENHCAFNPIKHSSE